MKLATLVLPLASSVLLAAEYRISGPYTHDNLSLFLIHGQGAGPKYVPLKEAMEQKKVVVHETKNVNELAIENVSDQDVYIQGGDIVKGGQQDRMISNDFVLPSKSGKLPISAFCVEQGRWSRRGAEPAQYFESSAHMAATKELKAAVNARKSQAEVWRDVARAQDGLAGSAAITGGVSGIRAPASPSSFQLTLESPPVAAAIDSYLKALHPAPAGKTDVVGLAIAINGQVNSADVYASPQLFAAMWPKLLRSAAVEAVRLSQKGKTFPPASAAAIQALLRGAEAGKESTLDIGRRTRLSTRETEKHVLFESRDGAGWVHRSYVSK